MADRIYRIVETLETDYREIKYNKFFIQSKSRFKWKDVNTSNGLKSELIIFETFKEAEKYLITEFCGSGSIIKPRVNEYHYTMRTFHCI